MSHRDTQRHTQTHKRKAIHIRRSRCALPELNVISSPKNPGCPTAAVLAAWVAATQALDVSAVLAQAASRASARAEALGASMTVHFPPQFLRKVAGAEFFQY